MRPVKRMHRMVATTVACAAAGATSRTTFVWVSETSRTYGELFSTTHQSHLAKTLRVEVM